MAIGLIIGKFMPPTLGHKFLIDFAKHYPTIDQVEVVVGSMDREPIPGNYRYNALYEHYWGDGVVRIHRLHKDLPQDPSEHPDFWNIWKKELEVFIDYDELTYPPDIIVFASEPYGAKLAEVLGARFVPVDIDRQIYPVSGTSVREFLDKQTMLQCPKWEMILPEARRYFTKKITLFGAESTGKSTTARKLAQMFNGQFIPEYARGYLEAVGTEDITFDKMKDIAHGQVAQDEAVYHNPMSMWLFRDTDILTTLGYFRLFNIPGSIEWIDIRIQQWAENTASDLYVILDDNIPLVKDPVRYGGDNRQSNTQFWVDICKEAGVPYVVIDSKTDRALEAQKAIRQHFKED